MLKVPDKRARNLLDLADLIDQLEPDAFDMKSWQTCICGHYLHSKGYVHIASDDWIHAARCLGLTDEKASELFAPGSAEQGGIPIINQGPKEAAERIRKFAFALAD